MTRDDEAVHEACLSPHPVQGLAGPHRIQVYNAGAEEFPDPAQRHCLGYSVMMPEGVNHLGDYQVGHEHLLPGDQRAFYPATSDLRLRTRLTDQQAKHHGGVKPDGHSPIP